MQYVFWIILIILLIGVIVSFKFFMDEIQVLNFELKNITAYLDRILKRISILHNQNNITNPKPLAWLTPEERVKASELKKTDPYVYDFVIKCFELFLTNEKRNNDCDN